MRAILLSVYTSFNTSHVVVYLDRQIRSLVENEGFNTSHVVVYPFLPPIIFTSLRSFNTSHVVVYPISQSIAIVNTLVSIHLML